MKYVQGYVSECFGENNLMVVCEDGKKGYVPAEEVTRLTARPGTSYQWMRGHQYHFAVTDTLEDETYLLSGKKYEEHRWAAILDDLEAKRSNVYTGRFRGISKVGISAYYEIEQGITVKILKEDFTYNRIDSFSNIHMPYYLPIVVTNVDPYGQECLIGCAKPAFGSFLYNINKLDAKPGSVLTGYIQGSLKNGHLVVRLAPNLMALLEKDAAPVGSWVQVVCTKIFPQRYQKLKVEFLRVIDPQPDVNYADWIVPVEQLPAYVDLEEFDNSIKAISRLPGGRNEPASTEKKTPMTEKSEPVALTWPQGVSQSPYSTFPDEQVVYNKLPETPSSLMQVEMRKGVLGQDHLVVAKAISELHYTTSFQLQRYLYMKNNVYFREKELQDIIDRLLKHEIVASLRFSSRGKECYTRILFPGLRYQQFTGTRSNFYPHEYAEYSASIIKSRLAANHLLLGLYNTVDVLSHEHRPFLAHDGEDGQKIRVKPKHKLISKDTYYLEAVRCGKSDDILGKLHRYQQYFDATKQKGVVLITLENAEERDAFADKVKAARFNFDVGLVDDPSAIPKPEFVWVEKDHAAEVPKKKSVFQMLFAI